LHTPHTSSIIIYHLLTIIILANPPQTSSIIIYHFLTIIILAHPPHILDLLDEVVKFGQNHLIRKNLLQDPDISGNTLDELILLDWAVIILASAHSLADTGVVGEDTLGLRWILFA
jgi:hypothetical protein